MGVRHILSISHPGIDEKKFNENPVIIYTEKKKH